MILKKNRRYVVAACFGLLAALNFTACREQEMVQPKPTGAARKAADQADVQLINVHYRHLLTGYGSQTLAYNADHQLQQMSYSASLYRTYHRYLFQGMPHVETKFYSGGKLIRKDVYVLNAAGRCTKSFAHHYHPVSGALVSTVPYKYEYDGAGLLRKSYNSDNPTEQCRYFYGNPGNLTQVLVFGPSGNLIKRLEYQYANPAWTNPYRFHPDKLDHLEFHLRIFGTFSKYLPTRCIEKNGQHEVLTDLQYQYELDSDGFPTNRESFNTAGQLVVTLPYQYQLVPIVIL
jgi:hypothetical protein